jgi:Thiol-disulfide isomerase and thioredoxins
MRRHGLVILLVCIFYVGANDVPAQSKRTAPAVKPIDVKGVERLIHERKGKILFLNVWATWCKPCIEEFPDIVRLYSEYPDSVVDIVAISVDYPDEVESKILPLLVSHNVTFRVYVADVKKDEDFINVINPSWSGAVPATFIFDADGKQRSFVFGQKSYPIFKAEIDTVLSSR